MFGTTVKQILILMGNTIGFTEAISNLEDLCFYPKRIDGLMKFNILQTRMRQERWDFLIRLIKIRGIMIEFCVIHYHIDLIILIIR